MRQCTGPLKSFLDANLIGIDLSIPESDRLVMAALSCVGVSEDGGDNKGFMVEQFQSCVTHPASQSWCMDFVQSMIAYIELTSGLTSGLAATESCLELWNQSRLTHRVVKPMPGDVIVWQLGNTAHGHCGFVIGEDDDMWMTVEGNTSAMNEIDRNGDGVYQKKRRKNGSVTFRELGFLRVFS